MRPPLPARLPSILLGGALAAWLAAPAAGVAEIYTLDQFASIIGHGVSSNGVYAVAGSMGEAVAGPKIRGGGYVVEPGLQTRLATLYLPEGPVLLRVTQNGPSVEISWPVDFDGDGAFMLETTTTVELPASWQPVREIPLEKDGARILILEAQFERLFFRLRRSSLR